MSLRRIGCLEEMKLLSKDLERMFFSHEIALETCVREDARARRDRVSCLFQEDTKEKPSDIDGILYVEFKKSVKETFPEIAEKLKAIGLIKA